MPQQIVEHLERIVCIVVAVDEMAVAQYLSLDLEEPCFDSDGPAQAPEEGCQPHDQSTFDGRVCRVVGKNIVLERPVGASSSRTLTTPSAVMPWRKALRLERRLPFWVRGPVLFCALSRLAAICRSEAISARWRFGQGLGS
jgi:hypothetical protein